MSKRKTLLVLFLIGVGIGIGIAAYFAFELQSIGSNEGALAIAQVHGIKYSCNIQMMVIHNSTLTFGANNITQTTVLASGTTKTLTCYP